MIFCASLVSLHSRQEAPHRDVSIFVQVSDKAGGPVRDLSAADFDVRIGGRSQAVRLVRDAPSASVQLLLDISGSLRDEMIDRFADAVATLAPDIRGRHARVAVFASTVEWMPETGLDRPAVHAFIRNSRVGTPTALWDTVRALAESAKGQGRRVIVIASDGADSMSRIKAVDLTRLVVRHNVQVHGIALRPVPPKNSPFTRMMNPLPNTSDFERLVSMTGGAYSELRDNSQVVSAMSRALMNIDAEIELQVDVADIDQKHQKVHDVRVQVKRPGLAVRAPRSIVLPQMQR